jgi:hypothetical protein
MSKASMFVSKVGRPFRATKEMHLAIIQALINVYSKIGFFVANLSASIGMCLSSKKSFSSSPSKVVSNHLPS